MWYQEYSTREFEDLEAFVEEYDLDEYYLDDEDDEIDFLDY